MNLIDALVLHVCGWSDDRSREMQREASEIIYAHRRKLYLEREISDAQKELEKFNTTPKEQP